MIDYNYIINILKDFGRTKGHVWLVSTNKHCGALASKVDLKYDTTRRYYMSQIHQVYEEYRENVPLTRVPQDVFESNVKYLLSKGYTLSF